MTEFSRCTLKVLGAIEIVGAFLLLLYFMVLCLSFVLHDNGGFFLGVVKFRFLLQWLILSGVFWYVGGLSFDDEREGSLWLMQFFLCVMLFLLYIAGFFEIDPLSW